ncbi:aldo/keto reductase [Streptomyces sp. NPDC005820]|uniref:aldo/keto reductase n=1 Tax=Streptomyces sp. NPDC005820 TaxID=3157069 RepID=UPI0033DC41EB
MTATTNTTYPIGKDVEIPAIGLGTWPLKGHVAEDAVRYALSQGYRLVDTASAYENEREVGRGLRSSGVPRSDVFVTTKLGNSHHGREETLRAFDRSLSELGLDHLDLYLIHWPVPALDLYVETWRTLAELQQEGRVRAIGVSNFKPAHLRRLVEETGVVPAVNQIELNPLTNRAAEREYHQENGILTQSWSPLGPGTGLLDSEVITGIARAHHRTPGQVILRWHLQLGLSATPKSASPERITQNLQVFDFTLSDSEVHAITALDTGETVPMDSDLPLGGMPRQNT